MATIDVDRDVNMSTVVYPGGVEMSAAAGFQQGSFRN